jgi:hypothetical protein
LAIRRGRCQKRPSAGRFRDPSVTARRGLEHDERTAFAHQRKERLVERDGLLGRDADVDGDAALAQKGKAAAADGRIRVLDRGDDARDAGVDDLAHAGPGATLVAAGLERAIQRRAAGAHARLGQGVHFRVRLPRSLMEALTHDNAVGGHDDRAH